MKYPCWPFCITCLLSCDASYWRNTSLKDMTIIGGTYQTILNRLMLQSCQLCDIAHDFWYDPHINTNPQNWSKNLQLRNTERTYPLQSFFTSFCLLILKRKNLQSTVRRMFLIRTKKIFSATTPSSWNAAGQSPSTWCGLRASLTRCLAYQSYIAIIQPIQRLQSTKVVCLLIFLSFQHRFLYWIPTNIQITLTNQSTN
jgi:hypothetical protein